MEVNGRQVKIGIALSAGASHGWAHIGVLRRLSAAGIEPDVVAGCSVGALVGAYYAAGKLDLLEDWVRALTVRGTFAYSRLRRGHSLFGSRLLREMCEHFRGLEVEDLRVRFGAVATDLATGYRRLLRAGSVTRVVAASGAFPLLFPPVKVDGAWAVDGSLSDPVPAAACRAMGADVVIAVKVLGSGGDSRIGAEVADEAGRWVPLLTSDSETGGAAPARAPGVPGVRTRAVRARTRLRHRVVQGAAHRLRRAIASASRSGTTPDMVSVALRSTVARARARHAMKKALRSADIVIVPGLGRLRLGAEAAVRAISAGYEAADDQIDAIAAAAMPAQAVRWPDPGDAALALA